MNAQVGLCQAGRHRRRRLSPQPAQDLLHPPRRRWPRYGPDRCRGAPRALPPRSPAEPLHPTRADCWRRLRRSARCQAIGARLRRSWGRQHPPDLVRVHRADGRRRPDPSDPDRDLERQLHGRTARAALPRCSTAAPTAGCAHEFILDCRPFEKSAGDQGRGHRQAPDGLWLPRADDERSPCPARSWSSRPRASPRASSIASAMR
jgi:hypothetical protein